MLTRIIIAALFLLLFTAMDAWGEDDYGLKQCMTVMEKQKLVMEKRAKVFVNLYDLNLNNANQAIICKMDQARIYENLLECEFELEILQQEKCV